MSPDGSDRSQGNGRADDGWQQYDPFQQGDDPLRPRPPLRDPFEQPPHQQPPGQRPDPFASQEDPFGLPDPFEPMPPFDPSRDYIDPFQPDSAQFPEDPGAAEAPRPPAAAGGASWDFSGQPSSEVDPFAPAPPEQRFPGAGQTPPGPAQPYGGAPPAPEPPTDPYGYGADQRGQAPIPSRAARHQAKRRIPWRPSRGPAGAGPPGGAPPGGAAPPGPAARGAPPAQEPGRGPVLRGAPPGPAPGAASPPGPPAGAGPARGPGGPVAGGSPFEPAPPFEPDGWRPVAEPPEPTEPPEPPQQPRRRWPSRPRNGDRTDPGAHQDLPRHTRPFGQVMTDQRLEPAASNGLADPRAPARPRAPRRGGRLPDATRLRPAIPKIEVPSGLSASSLGLAAILVVATLGLSMVSRALPKADGPPTPPTAAPYSARWVCPTLPGEATSVGVANVGGAAASLRTTVVSGSDRGQPVQRSLRAGAAGSLKVLASRQPGYAQVEAFSAPVVVSEGGRGGCAPGPTDRLWIPTSDTSLGATTTVVLANPDGDPAVVDLVPHVSQGSQQSVAEVFIPPRSAVTKPFSYGELVGLKPAIEVIAKSGRVVAGAEIAQKDRQKIYVPAQSAPKSQWSFAGGLAGTDRSTFVLITNPSANPLSVSVQVSTDRGTFKPGNDFDNPVPGGAAVAIQVPPLQIGGSGAFAVRARSRDGAPFVAALRVTTPSPRGTTSYMDLGSSDADTRWLVPTVPASKRVVLANLGGDALSARLGGAGSGAGAGSAVQVGAGKVVVRDLPASLKSLEVTTDGSGLLVAPLGGGLALPGAAIGGVPAGGPVVAESVAS
jgi:Family of unknown function (DUF5719)